jgi:hypothetical protein
MLNLKVAMNLLTVFSKIVIGINMLMFNFSTAVEPVISYPLEGDVVEGVVEILGSVPETDLSFAKLSYSYHGDEENWFLIARIDKPVENGLLATWDTSTITDGNYQLKLTIKTTDGAKKEVIISNITVANYSRQEVQLNGEGNIAGAGAMTTRTSSPGELTPTPLPANPAAISDGELRRTIVKGGIFGSVIILAIMSWTTIRTKFNRR